LNLLELKRNKRLTVREQK